MEADFRNPGKTVFLVIYGLVILLIPGSILSQSPDNAFWIQPGYAVQLPAGDLAGRFGANLSPGLQFSYHWGKKKLVFETHTAMLLGSHVKEPVLAPLLTPEGFLIGVEGTYANVSLRQRGWYNMTGIGKLWQVSPKNQSSILKLSIGGGFLQHKIRIQEDPQNATPQVGGDLKKGYDRLSNGLALGQTLTYYYFHPKDPINFSISLEFIQAWTQNRRDFDYDLMANNGEQRLDILMGLRLAWVFPVIFYSRPEEILY